MQTGGETARQTSSLDIPTGRAQVVEGNSKKSCRNKRGDLKMNHEKSVKKSKKFELLFIWDTLR